MLPLLAALVPVLVLAACLQAALLHQVLALAALVLELARPAAQGAPRPQARPVLQAVLLQLAEPQALTTLQRTQIRVLELALALVWVPRRAAVPLSRARALAPEHSAARPLPQAALGLALAELQQQAQLQLRWRRVRGRP